MNKKGVLVLITIALFVAGCATQNAASERAKLIPCHEVRISVTLGAKPLKSFRVDFRVNNVDDTFLNSNSPGLATLHVNDVSTPCTVIVFNHTSNSPIFYCSFALPNGVMKDEAVSFDLDTCKRDAVEHHKKNQ